jgi:hypothetical protein
MTLQTAAYVVCYKLSNGFNDKFPNLQNYYLQQLVLRGMRCSMLCASSTCTGVLSKALHSCEADGKPGLRVKFLLLLLVRSFQR